MASRDLSRLPARAAPGGFGIPPSVVVVTLYAGLHAIAHIYWVVTLKLPDIEGVWLDPLVAGVSLLHASLGVGVLLTAYVGLDMWRAATTPSPRRKVGLVVCTAAMVLCVGLLVYLVRLQAVLGSGE